MFRDIILNTILFFPFGFLLQMISKRNKICIYSFVIPLTVSFFIEVMQYVFYLGVTDITDVIDRIIVIRNTKNDKKNKYIDSQIQSYIKENCLQD